MSRATILLPNYNNERVLPITFEYLRRYIDCTQVGFVMVDDGSEDDSVQVAKREIPKCHFAESELIERSHEGIVPTLNIAVQAVKTDTIIRIDGDATVETPDWVNRLLQILQHDEVGIVGGQVVWEHGTIHTLGRSLFSEYGLHDMGCCPLEAPGRRTFDSIVHRPRHRLAGGLPYEVDTILGVCVAFRKRDAIAIGGFDMRFNPVWIEDDDFGVGMRLLGKRIIVDPEIKVIHRPSLRGSRKAGVVRAGKTLSKQAIVRSKAKVALRKLRGALYQRIEDAIKPGIQATYPMVSESDPWRRAILVSHYQKWREKWGFDPINPDLYEIFCRYWETPLCWRANPLQLAQSRAFLSKMAEGA